MHEQRKLLIEKLEEIALEAKEADEVPAASILYALLGSMCINHDILLAQCVSDFVKTTLEPITLSQMNRNN
ncbi:hypothetical protein ACFLQL_02330 [Verrucomicrobiota bacterium]